jgi:hypothetical protein
MIAALALAAAVVALYLTRISPLDPKLEVERALIEQ